MQMTILYMFETEIANDKNVAKNSKCNKQKWDGARSSKTVCTDSSE